MCAGCLTAQERPAGPTPASVLPADAPANRIKREAQPLFHLNSRYVGDAILEAQAVIQSQKELRPLQIRDLARRIAKLDRALPKAERILKPPDSPETAAQWEKRRTRLQDRRTKALTRQGELEAHRDHGTIPTVIFGGRRLLRRLTRSHGARPQALRRAWRLTRQGMRYARGDGAKGGNPNIRITGEADGRFGLQVALSHQAERRGTDGHARPLMSAAPRTVGELWIPDKVRPLVRDARRTGHPYSVRIVEEIRSAPARHPGADGAGRGGLDENPHGHALANVGPRGALEPFPADLVLPAVAGGHKLAGIFRSGGSPGDPLAPCAGVPHRPGVSAHLFGVWDRQVYL